MQFGMSAVPGTGKSQTSIVRVLILLVVGGWIVLSPAYRQVYGGSSFWFPRWVMFHGYGRNVCTVDFFEVVKREDKKSRWKKIDRYEVLGVEKDWLKNRSIVRMKSKQDVRQMGTRLCDAMGDGADVRAKAYCGSRGKWKRSIKGKERLCKERDGSKTAARRARNNKKRKTAKGKKR